MVFVPLQPSPEEETLVVRSDEFDVRRAESGFAIAWSGCSLAVEAGASFTCSRLIAFGRDAHDTAAGPLPAATRAPGATVSPADVRVVWSEFAAGAPRRVMATIDESERHTLAITAVWEDGRSTLLEITEGSGVLRLTARWPSGDGPESGGAAPGGAHFEGTLLDHTAPSHQSGSAVLTIGARRDAYVAIPNASGAALTSQGYAERTVVAGILSLPATVAAQALFARGDVDPRRIIELDAQSH